MKHYKRNGAISCLFIPLRCYQHKLKEDVGDIRSSAFSQDGELIPIPFRVKFDQTPSNGRVVMLCTHLNLSVSMTCACEFAKMYAFEINTCQVFF